MLATTGRPDAKPNHNQTSPQRLADSATSVEDSGFFGCEPTGFAAEAVRFDGGG